MKTKTILAFSLLIVAVYLVQCGDKTEHHNEHHKGAGHHMHSQSKNKVVVSDGVQFSFDLMPMKQHMKMMKSMNMKMDMPKGANYGLMVTLMDKDKKVIKDAKVSIEVAGKAVDAKISKDCEMMSGGGMFHYGTHIKIPNKGKVKIKANAKIKGKTKQATAAFTI